MYNDNNPEVNNLPPEVTARAYQLNRGADVIIAELEVIASVHEPTALELSDEHVAAVIDLARKAGLDQGEIDVPEAA